MLKLTIRLSLILSFTTLVALALGACGSPPTATPAPTSAPTAAPTRAPATPTTAPAATLAPTVPPSVAPTVAGTGTPLAAAGTVTATAPVTFTVVIQTAAPTATPTNTPGPSVTPVTVPTASTAAVVKLGQGNILTDAQGMTLYTFKGDSPGKTTCTDTCATTWPPLTIPFNTVPSAPGVSGNIGILERPDGKYQVTYNEQALYRYSKDTKAGDTNGNGVDGQWSTATMQAPPTPAATTAASPTAAK